MIPYLPEDLESEIFARVPTKTLVKWQSTCKRWYTLFKDPHFVKKNLGKSDREVILESRYGVYSISFNYHGIHKGIDPSMEFRGKLKDLEISEIFHCEGLVLCIPEENTTRIFVWNPCTGQTRLIKPRTGFKGVDTYALGYDNINSSYKILRFVRYKNSVPASEFEIYDLSSDSWRVLDGFSEDWYVINDGVSLKENAYWVAFDKETGFFLLGFDFITEKFWSLHLPYQSHNRLDVAALSVVKDERLSLLSHHFVTHPKVAKIWVTNKFGVDTKNMSWTNLFVVDFGQFRLPGRLTNVTSFLLDQENKVVVCCHREAVDDRTIIYILGEHIYKEVYRDTREGISSNWPFLVSYVLA